MLQRHQHAQTFRQSLFPLCRIRAAAGVVDEKVEPCTKFIVAPKDIEAKTVAEKLGLSLDTDTFPEGMYLVNQQFVGKSLGAGKLLDPTQ